MPAVSYSRFAPRRRNPLLVLCPFELGVDEIVDTSGLIRISGALNLFAETGFPADPV
jgi:hypothetical protein